MLTSSLEGKARSACESSFLNRARNQNEARSFLSHGHKPDRADDFSVTLATAQIQVERKHWNLNDPWEVKMKSAVSALLNKHVPRLKTSQVQSADRKRIQAMVQLLTELTGSASDEEVLVRLDIAIRDRWNFEQFVTCR